MIGVNIHLVDDETNNILSTMMFTLSPLESKLSLAAIRTGVMGAFKAHCNSSSPVISKNSVSEWPMLKSSEVYTSIECIKVNSPSEHFSTYQKFIENLKSYDSLMFVQVQGQDTLGISLLDNWIVEDDATSAEDVIQTQRRKTEGITDSEDSQQTSAFSVVNNGKEETASLDLCLVKGYLMPAPTFRVTVRGSRTAKDLRGKEFTMYDIFVKQGSLVSFILIYLDHFNQLQTGMVCGAPLLGLCDFE